ncbi:sugar transferase, partial [Streptomyces sp. NPDC059900]
MQQGELVDPFPPAPHGRLANGTISRPASDWEQRYRRTVITSDTVVTAFVVASIGIFFGARDAANWHEKWGILAFGTELLVLGALAVSRAWAPA